MAELKFNTLYDQMSGANQDFYDDYFQQNYDPNKQWTNQSNSLTMKSLPDQSTPDFNAMQNAYNQAAQSKTANKFNWGSLLGMSSADAAMPTDAETAAIERSGINNTSIAQGPWTMFNQGNRPVGPMTDRIMDPDLMEQAQYRSMLEREPVNVPGINFKDAPVSFFNRQNNPTKGLYDRNIAYRALNKGTPEATAKWLADYNAQPGQVWGEGDAIQDRKGFKLPSFLGAGLGAIRDKLRPSPEEQFGASYFPQTDTGRVYQDPNQQLYGGMNVDTMWGEGIGGTGQKRIDRLQKTIDNYQKQWGHLDQDEYDMKLKRRQDQLKEFKTQQTAYSNALAAQNIQAQKDRAAADAATQQRAQDRAAGAFSSQVRQDPGGGGTWHQQTRAKERQGQQVAGPGFGSGAYFNQGGRVGYSNGGRVGILSVF